MCKSCCQNKAPRSQLKPRSAAIGLFVLGIAISIHLFFIHAVYGWLLLAAVLVLGHAIIVSGLAWLVSSARHNHGLMTHAEEATGDHSHVLHNPRAYDWLAKVITLGGEGRFRRRTIDLAKIQPGDTVLDVGCGTGTLLIEAAKRCGSTGSAHGVDRSVEMLAYARKKAAAQGVNAQFQDSSSDGLPFPDASFDVVFCTLMLHHLPVTMQMATVTEMRRVLKPAGRIVIVDMRRQRKLSALFSHIGLIHVLRSHANIPDWEKIEELLVRQGVQVAGRRPVWGETVCALVGQIAA